MKITAALSTSFVLTLAVSKPPLLAQSLIRELPGPAADSSLGRWIVGLGDVDADGTPDFAATLLGSTHPTGGVLALSGADGSTLWSLDSPSAVADEDVAMELVPDLDADGVGELVLGFPLAGATAQGRVEMRSGATGALMWSFEGRIDGGRLGQALDGIEDLNGDGVRDLIVGSPLQDNDTRTPQLFVLSGIDGGRLFRIAAPRHQERGFGLGVSSVPDLDADGREDIALTTRSSAEVLFYSSATQALLGEWNDPVGGTSFTEIDVLDDLDGDGRPEIMVTGTESWLNGGNLESRGRFVAFSIPTGDVLRERVGQSLVSFLVPVRYAGAVVGDVDLDGFQDVLLGEVDRSDPRAVFVSGRTGGTLYRFPVSERGDRLAVAAAGDVDGDGRLDLAVGDRSGGAGKISLYAGAEMMLRASARRPRVDEEFALSLGEGVPGSPAFLMLRQVDGAPSSIGLTPVTPLDAEGRLTVRGSIPPGLSGLELGFRGYAIGRSGVVETALELVSVR